MEMTTISNKRKSRRKMFNKKRVGCFCTHNMRLRSFYFVEDSVPTHSSQFSINRAIQLFNLFLTKFHISS